MANTVPSPNMSLPVPVVGVDPGPDWANNINASLSIIDGHTHSAGSGVQVTPSGLNISADLPFNGNNATQLRSARFAVQGSPISGGADLGCVYVSGVDLWYNDESGNQVRITSGGNVNAGAGSITGLPSGTASASYSTGAFTFQGATNTPAGMNVGPLTIGAEIANAKTVTLQASASQASNIAFTLPLTLPGSTSFLSSDSSGNMATVASMGTGDVILGPGITGTGNIVSSAGANISGAGITTSTIDSSVIGGTTPAAATVTTLNATSITASANIGATGSVSAGGGSGVKWQLYQGTLGSSLSVTTTAISGNIFGTTGVDTTGQVQLTSVNVGNSNLYMTVISATQVTITNPTGGTRGYKLIVFYD